MDAAQDTIRSLTVAEARDLAAPLMREHWEEVGSPRLRHLQQLDPRWDVYETLEAMGQLVLLGAFAADGALVGYSCTIANEGHLHYAALPWAPNDVLFVTKSHRRSRLGLRLIEATEAAVRARFGRPGVLTMHAKPGTTLDLMLPKMGYHLHEHIYFKEL